jgi:hypothetical protein
VTSLQQYFITEKTKPTSRTGLESEFPYLAHLADITFHSLLLIFYSVVVHNTCQLTRKVIKFKYFCRIMLFLPLQ